MKEHIDNKSLSFRIQTISIKEAKIALKNMNPKMSSGVSGIPKKIVRDAHEILAVPFQRVFNESVKQCYFPNAFKELSSVCVHKRNSKDDKANYRQIVSIEAISSCMESIINKQLLKFLIENTIIPPEQYAFIPGIDVGTVAFIKTAISKWLLNIDKELYTVITSFDLASAFSTLSITLVLKRMTIYGVDKNSL